VPVFDQWYAEMGHSASRDQIVRRALRLPPDMEASGLLPWAGVAEVATALNLAPGQLLVDLGCGRGGYSLEIARQTGARLLGLDFSDERLPPWARRIDLMRDLTEAGFEQVDVAGKPAWREAERDLYELSIQADAAGDPAIESLPEQARRGLELFDSSRRVCASATAPG
jgi:SAM-dependent methyltransferase